MKKVIYTHRGGSPARLNEVNPIPLKREVMVEEGTNKFKIGDGESSWQELPYAGDFYVDGPSLTLLYENAKV